MNRSTRQRGSKRAGGKGLPQQGRALACSAIQPQKIGMGSIVPRGADPGRLAPKGCSPPLIEQVLLAARLACSCCLWRGQEGEECCTAGPLAAGSFAGPAWGPSCCLFKRWREPIGLEETQYRLHSALPEVGCRLRDSKFGGRALLGLRALGEHQQHAGNCWAPAQVCQPSRLTRRRRSPAAARHRSPPSQPPWRALAAAHPPRL